jgi:hypothetical protein
MLLHLPTLPVAVSTVPWETIRRHELLLELKAAGFDDIELYEGERAAPHWKGVNRNLMRILETMPVPFLLLEDDARFLPAYQPSIRVHDDAAATYLGGTRHGNPLMSIPEPATGVAQSLIGGLKPDWATMHAPFDVDHVRVFNMQSCHAILFHNPHGIETFGQQLANSLDSRPADIAFAEIHRDTLVLLRHPPFWFQDDVRNVQVTSSIL